MFLNLDKQSVTSSSPTKEDISRCICSRYKFDSETSQSLLELTKVSFSKLIHELFTH